LHGNCNGHPQFVHTSSGCPDDTLGTSNHMWQLKKKKKGKKKSIHPRSTLMTTNLWAVINSWLQRLCVVSGQLVFLWLSKHSIAFYDYVSSRWVAWLQIYRILYWTQRYFAQKTFTDYESSSKIFISFHRLEQCFSTSVRLRPGKFFFHKTRARSK